MTTGESGDVEEADEDFVVAEYVSDDDSAEDGTKADKDESDEEHVTKVF